MNKKYYTIRTKTGLEPYEIASVERRGYKLVKVSATPLYNERNMEYHVKTLLYVFRHKDYEYEQA